jgi:hypothetical protein
MGKTRVSWIIHIFALLHATVALICRRTGVEDELLLTILTMTMALIICVKKGFRVEFSAASIITVNIIGYLLGNAGAVLFSRILGSSIFANVLSTTVTTEIIGWSIVAFSKILNQDKIVPRSISSQFLKWIILVMGSVFALRIGIILLISCRMFTPGSLMDATSRLFSNSFALITMLCLNILYVRGSDRLTARISQEWKPLVLISFMIAASLIGAALSGIGLSFEFTIDSWLEFVQTLIVTFIVQVTTYCIVYMVNYTISAGNRMQKEKEKKHVAQYRYQKLKRQVNPHFLFNSLNALDCLVWEEKTEQASTYIHKLAGVYRYMIKSEDEDFVQLDDELTFVEMYIALLKVRFPEGFDVIINVRKEDKARFVLPCSIQLLIENATKLNAVGAEKPLVVHVTSDGSQVCVSNNVVPKVTKVQSTGLGHKYIRQQYLDISGKEIQIEKTEEEYAVSLPLL